MESAQPPLPVVACSRSPPFRMRMCAIPQPRFLFGRLYPLISVFAIEFVTRKREIEGTTYLMTGYFLEKAGEQKDDISEDRVFFREGRSGPCAVLG